MKKILKPAFVAGLLATSSPNILAGGIENIQTENECSSLVENSKNRVVAIIEWWETGKNKLTYCKFGEKIFSLPIATGKPHKDGGVYTPEWNFLAGRTQKDKKSNSYKNSSWKPAKMPNAVHVYRGIWIHAGKIKSKTDEILKYPSHWCVRLGYNDSEKFFNQVNFDKNEWEKVEIVIRWTDPRKNKNPKK